MARYKKEDQFSAKRNEILDFALSLVYSKGYQEMTIQDILDGLHISRGALYHYFASKTEIMEALVERVGMNAAESLAPIFQDPDLSAIEKFHRYFENSTIWKRAQKPFILDLLRVWYSDENAMIRQKITSLSLKQTSALFEPVIRQGIAEEVFMTPYPQQAAVIVTGIALSLADTFVDLMAVQTGDPTALEKAKITQAAYVDAVERVLGAPTGCLKIADDSLTEWMGSLATETDADPEKEK